MIYPWQSQQWQRLTADVEQNRLAHALLLSGAQGLGKFDFAREFAQYLLCTQRQSGSCGVCASCRLSLANTHPDLITLVPEDSPVIKIEQVRQLSHAVAQTAKRGGHQVVLIYPAEALNKAAANALLKTLEEPAGAVVLLLISHQPGALPPTILSRCQRLDFTRMDVQQAIVWLNQQCLANQISLNAQLLLRIAEFSPLRALALAQNNYLQLRDQLLTHLLAIVSHKLNPVTAASYYLDQDLEGWVNAFISLLMDIVRLQLGADQHALVNSDCWSSLQAISQVYPLTSALAMLTRVQEARQWLLDSAVHLNTQLLLESLLCSL